MRHILAARAESLPNDDLLILALYASRMMSHCDDPAGRATIRWNVVRKQMRRETTAEAESVEADLIWHCTL